MKAVIDRIAGNNACLLFNEDEIEVTIPVKLLPKNIKEGDFISVKFSIDKKLTSERMNRNRELLEKIKTRNIE